MEVMGEGGGCAGEEGSEAPWKYDLSLSLILKMGGYSHGIVNS